MSFKVSNSFKRRETISKMRLIQLFQLCDPLNVKHAINEPQQSRGFRVSVVSIYIPLVNETAHQVLGAVKRLRAFLLIGRRDSTRSDPCSFQNCAWHEVPV